MGRWRTHNNRAKPRWVFDEESDTYVLHSRKHGVLWKDKEIAGE